MASALVVKALRSGGDLESSHGGIHSRSSICNTRNGNQNQDSLSRMHDAVCKVDTRVRRRCNEGGDKYMEWTKEPLSANSLGEEWLWAEGTHMRQAEEKSTTSIELCHTFNLRRSIALNTKRYEFS